MKGWAHKVSCSSRKVGGKTWRSFWHSVKNAQFHPTKHLSRWVPKLEAERYSTPSIFSAHWHFRLFCSRWPSFLRNDHWGDDKAYLWSVVKNSRYDRFTDIQTSGTGVWTISDKYRFVRKRQKLKGRASKVSCSSQKVGGNTWGPFWRSVKNAQFHPMKHLSRWVPKLEAEQ